MPALINRRSESILGAVDALLYLPESSAGGILRIESLQFDREY